MPDQASRPWPPPPDLASLQELMRNADPEGLIASGAPADEYDPEELKLLQIVTNLSTNEMTVGNILPPLEALWRESFSLSDQALAQRRPLLQSLAEQIERFFGPKATPLTRSQPTEATPRNEAP